MTHSHTPGPWHIESAVPATFNGISGNHTLVCNVDNSLIICPTGITGTPDTQANAHLIAAAPEMLEALRECSGALIRDASISERKEVLARAGKAIAKAEGVL